MKLKVILTILIVLLIFPLLVGANAAPDKLKLYFFHSPHCGACTKIKQNYLPKILEKYGNLLKIISLDTTKPEPLSTLISLSEEYNKQGAFVPSILINNQLLTGTKEIKNNLEQILTTINNNEQKIIPAKDKKVKLSPVALKGIVAKFRKISLPSLIAAGLVDGVNPCAMSVIIFFISFLVTYGYKRREMVYISICYIASVFITYILIGFGLFKVLYYSDTFLSFVDYFYYAVVAFCLLFAFISLRDYFYFRKNRDMQGWILRLPQGLRKKIDKIIQIKMGRSHYLSIIKLALLSLAVGHIVSVLEGVCTGQIYLPVISFILKIPAMQSQALFYLIVYNLAFILPLVIVFLFTLIGISSDKFNKILHSNLGLIKLMMAIVFLFLGLLIFYSSALGF
jgi:thiol-disulfide isomerase/thioredoxin